MRFLFTTFEGGGHVPPALRVARRLQERGHQVLFVSDEANRAAAQASGLAFEPWPTAPNRAAMGAEDDPLDDWRPRLPTAVVRSVCEAVITGPAARYARDAQGFIDAFAPDAVVSNELLLGALAAAEARGKPIALLTSNVWCYPTREDIPPFGPGFPPPRNSFEQGRDRTCRRMIGRWYDVGLADLNAARSALDLPPLTRVLDQLAAADLVLLGTSRAFDYGVEAPPAPFRYAGPLCEPPAWARDTGEAADLIDRTRPNVLVSFSTTFQDQQAVIARCIRALAQLPVRGIVTTGPAIDPQNLPAADNVRVLAHADHDRLAPHCAAMVCHGGHGTVLLPIMHGKPVICLVSMRDQPENAQRLAHAGAGLKLSKSAGVARIRKAILKVLVQRSYTDAAERLGAAVRAEANGGASAATMLEALVSAGGSSERLRARPA